MLKFLEPIVMVLLALLVITQMLIPAIRGTRSFPLFRREKKLVEELTDIKQAQREKDLQTQINKEKDSLK